MKNYFLVLAFLVLTQFVFAQKEEKDEGKGFKKENLFFGGSISAAFASDVFGIGGSPEFGYNLAKWADLGIVGNYNYTSYRHYGGYYSNDKLRQTIYGGGAFTRLFPVRFLFAQAQFEHNWIALKYLYDGGGSEKAKVSSNSLLVGAGYTTGRNTNSKSPYGYFSVLIDVLNDDYSPYMNYRYDNSGNVTGREKVPVIRAGFIVPLFQGGGR